MRGMFEIIRVARMLSHTNHRRPQQQPVVGTAQVAVFNSLRKSVQDTLHARYLTAMVEGGAATITRVQWLEKKITFAGFWTAPSDKFTVVFNPATESDTLVQFILELLTN
jgi:hypothetical protein